MLYHVGTRRTSTMLLGFPKTICLNSSETAAVRHLVNNTFISDGLGRNDLDLGVVKADLCAVFQCIYWVNQPMHDWLHLGRRQ